MLSTKGHGNFRDTGTVLYLDCFGGFRDYTLSKLTELYAENSKLRFMYKLCHNLLQMKKDKNYRIVVVSHTY